MDHRRVNAEPARQFADRLLALHRLKRNARLSDFRGVAQLIVFPWVGSLARPITWRVHQPHARTRLTLSAAKARSLASCLSAGTAGSPGSAESRMSSWIVSRSKVTPAM